MNVPRVVQITDRKLLPETEILGRIDRAGHTGRTRAGAFALLFRDKDLPSAERLAAARRLREATHAAGSALWIAADIALARDVGADGVHLASDASDQIAAARLGPAALVSIACHGLDDVVRAAEAGARAVLLSPIFSSPGKGPPIGTAAIAEARRRLAGHGSIGLVALGGVDLRNARACLDAGADAVASIRADLTSLL